MFKDIDIFLQAAQAIMQGRDPYSIPNLEVFSPLPFYFLFFPFVALPAPVTYAIWSAISAIVLLVSTRRRALVVLLSMPALLIFLLGQVDLVFLGLFAAILSGVAGGIALAFLVLKPHIVILLTPWMLWHWWKNDRRQILYFAMVLGLIGIGSLMMQPDWLLRWFERLGDRMRVSVSSSIWGLGAFLPAPLGWLLAAVVAIGVVGWAIRRNRVDGIIASGLLISPFLFSYNLIPLVLMLKRRVDLIGWTVFSWCAFAIAAWQLNDRAAAFLTLGTLFVLARAKIKDQ